ncbi:59_t:CDS:2, partial [Acaulospora colombiana]
MLCVYPADLLRSQNVTWPITPCSVLYPALEYGFLGRGSFDDASNGADLPTPTIDHDSLYT